MQVTYPSAHKWIEPVTEEAMSELGKNNRARLRSTLNRLEETTITHEVVPLSDAVLEWFTPLYNESIGSKLNPKVHDIHAATLGKGSDVQYCALIVHEDNEPIGATIFSLRTHVLSIAFRIYPQQWKSASVQANPSLYSEYLINRYAWQKGYKKISHGKDRNPYGINANIGLAVFKLSVGCSAYLPTTPYDICTIDTDTIGEDILILAQPENGNRITNAYLCIENANLDRYQHVQKYPEQLSVTVIER